MRLLGSFLIPALLVSTATFSSRADSRPTATLSLQKLKTFPGDVLRADLRVTEAVQNASASFANQTVAFQRLGHLDQWSVLVGIDLETKSGRYALKATITFVNGRTTSLEQFFQVLPKNFPVQRLQVEEKYVTLDSEAEKRAAEEARKLQAIWKISTSQKLWQGRFLSPVSSELTSGFGRRRIVNNQPRSPHSGVDLKATTGTPIKAANAGKVVLAEDLYFSGNTVVLDHGFGLYTYYAHCSTMAVKPGDIVAKGQFIGEVGATGRVTGPHLHWACRLNEARVNPLELTQFWMAEGPQSARQTPTHSKAH